MTFYEAAIQILLKEGRPLHAHEITERALEENLLSHVGKQPEAVMASRLASMARRSQDRRIVVVSPDTFGLADWNLATDAEALEASGTVEEPEEASQPPLRGQERHPKISRENVRIMGRGDRRRREEARRQRRAPKTLPEIVRAILTSAGVPLPLFELAAALRQADLVKDDLGRETLRIRLAEENEKKEDEIFFFFDDGLVGLEGMEPSGEVADAERLIEKAIESLVRPKPRAEAAPRAAAAKEDPEAESRQEAARQLRARLQDLAPDVLEGITLALLQEMGYRDLRIGKRQKEGSLFVAKRRMGLTEVRNAIRVVRGGREIRREDVQELRKDMAGQSALLGVLVSPGDPTREARSETARAGQPLVVLLCADALAEQLVERGIGVSSRTVTLVNFDPRALAARARRGQRSLVGRDEGEGRKAREGGEAKEKRERRSRRGGRKESARGDAKARAETEAKEEAEAPAEAKVDATAEPRAAKKLEPREEPKARTEEEKREAEPREASSARAEAAPASEAEARDERVEPSSASAKEGAEE